MEPRALGNYGGPKVDAKPVEDPLSQLAASEYNRLAEDSAQMTRTAIRAVVMFTATPSSGPLTYSAANVTLRSLWGTGDSYKPTVQKTSVTPGEYTITFSAAFADALGNSETLGFIEAFARARTSDKTKDPHAKVLTVSSNAITITTEEPRGTLADDDGANNLEIAVFIL